jgi:hypothetical protein
MNIKVRGIYATALTRFFLDRRARILAPSEPIVERFGESPHFLSSGNPDLDINEMEGGQGITIAGPPAPVHTAAGWIRSSFPDAVFLNLEEANDTALAWIEFTSPVKDGLDELRARVVPTLPNHHRLKLIDPEEVDSAEEELRLHPGEREGLARRLEQKLLWDRLAYGKEIHIEHIKPDGRMIYLSEGRIIDVDRKKRVLLLQRDRFRGRTRYDGLNLPKMPGDFAETEVREGAWHYHHTYHHRDGTPVGRYFNINTPVEFYPDRIRYVDLEIDVVQWTDGRTETIDLADLEAALKAGHIGEELAAKAERVSRELRERLGSLP